MFSRNFVDVRTLVGLPVAFVLPGRIPFCYCAAAVPPRVPAPPTLLKAHKDCLIVALDPQDGVSYTVEVAESPAILYYTWKAAPAPTLPDQLRIPDLQSNRGYVVRCTARNAAGVATSPASSTYLTLTPQADADQQLSDALVRCTQLEAVIDELRADLAIAHDAAAAKSTLAAEAASVEAAPPAAAPRPGPTADVALLQKTVAENTSTITTLRNEIRRYVACNQCACFVCAVPRARSCVGTFKRTPF